MGAAHGETVLQAQSTRPSDVGHVLERPQPPSDPLNTPHSPLVDAMQAGKHRSRRAISAGQPPLPPKSVGIGGIRCHQETESQPPDLKSRREGDYRDRRPLGFGGTPLVRATEARVRATAGGGRRGAAPPNSASPWYCLALREARGGPYTCSRAAAASLVVGGRVRGHLGGVRWLSELQYRLIGDRGCWASARAPSFAGRFPS